MWQNTRWRCNYLHGWCNYTTHAVSRLKAKISKHATYRMRVMGWHTFTNVQLGSLKHGVGSSVCRSTVLSDFLQFAPTAMWLAATSLGRKTKRFAMLGGSCRNIVVVVAGFLVNAFTMSEIKSIGPFFIQLQNEFDANAQKSSLFMSLLYGAYFTSGKP